MSQNNYQATFEDMTGSIAQTANSGLLIVAVTVGMVYLPSGNINPIYEYKNNLIVSRPYEDLRSENRAISFTQSESKNISSQSQLATKNFLFIKKGAGHPIINHEQFITTWG